MPAYTTADIRNVLLAGHGGSGKTTLADAMLFAAGAVTRKGSVTDGSSVSDFEKEEKEHKHSIYSAVLHARPSGEADQYYRHAGVAGFDWAGDCVFAGGGDGGGGGERAERGGGGDAEDHGGGAGSEYSQGDCCKQNRSAGFGFGSGWCSGCGRRLGRR